MHAAGVVNVPGGIIHVCRHFIYIRHKDAVSGQHRMPCHFRIDLRLIFGNGNILTVLKLQHVDFRRIDLIAENVRPHIARIGRSQSGEELPLFNRADDIQIMEIHGAVLIRLRLHVHFCLEEVFDGSVLPGAWRCP